MPTCGKGAREANLLVQIFMNQHKNLCLGRNKQTKTPNSKAFRYTRNVNPQLH